MITIESRGLRDYLQSLLVKIIPEETGPSHTFKMADGVASCTKNVCMGSLARFVRFSCTIVTLSGAMYFLYNYMKRSRRSTKKSRQNKTLEVLFFPDKKLACYSFLQGFGCSRSKCPYAHEETSLSKLIKTISRAKQSLDVCVFTINCHELANAVVELHRNGVTVRVLTDDEQMGSTGSQIQKFREEGIMVRHDLSSFFMHHKFAIIDDGILVNGSFNWTRQAVTGNKENVVISDDLKLVRKFKNEFEKLWMEYDPSKRS